MRRYLVVANKTLGGDALVAAIRERVAAGPCQFWVVVPETRSADIGLAEFSPVMGGVPLGVPVKQRRADAQRKLDLELTRLREAGATADGNVGPSDPLQAIEQAVASEQFDEVIISTLPRHLSKWLHQDLPRRVERKFHLHVVHVEQGLETSVKPPT